MATKSIIEIPVDDSEFRRFYELFEKFKDETAEMPETWRAIDEAMGSATSTATEGALNAKEALAVAAAQAGVIAEALRGAVKAQSDLGTATSKTHKGMQGLQKSAEGVGRAISLVGGWIVKLGAIGGLGALFSGFGIGELASSALNRTRASGQLGVSTGQLASYQAHMQEFLGMGPLQGAASSQLDIRSGRYLAPLLGPGWMKAFTEPSTDLAIQLARAAVAKFKQNPALFNTGPYGQAYAALGGNSGDVRLIAAHQQAFDLAVRKMHADEKALTIDQQAAQAMIDFKTELDAAGFKIDTALIDNLAALAPPLEKITEEFAGFLTSFLNSKDFAKIVSNMQTALGDLGDYLASKQFLTDLKGFEAGIRWIVDAMKKVGAGPAINAAEKTYAALKSVRDFDTDAHLIAGFKQFGADFQKELGSMFGKSIGVASTIVGVAKSLRVDPLLSLAIAAQESGLRPNLHYSDASGSGVDTGLFALNSNGEAAGYDWKALLDPKTNATIALKQLARVMKESPASVLKQFSRLARGDNPKLTHDQIMAMAGTPGEYAVVAQRPQHPMQYASDINKRYADWSKHFPSEVAHAQHAKTQQQSADHLKSINKHLKAVLAKRTTPPKVNLHVTNPTASRHSVSLKAAIP